MVSGAEMKRCDEGPIEFWTRREAALSANHHPRKGRHLMKSRYVSAVISIAAVGAIAVPAVAQASHRSDDPVTHVGQEHHRADHRDRRGSDELARYVRRSDERPGDIRHGNDDGPNHR
jgi:hypothetical protein